MTAQDVIRFDCDNCGKTLKVPSNNAGKKGACPGCKQPIRVPEPELELELELADNETDWIDALPAAKTSEMPRRQQQPHSSQGTDWKEIVRSDVWIGVGLGGPIILWIVFLLFAVTGIDLLGSSDNSSDAPKMSVMGMFYMMLGFSVICIPMGLYRYRRAMQILKSGVETDYEITKFSGVRQGMLDATIEYSFNNKSYKKKVTIPKKQADAGFRLFIDPDKPKRVIVREIDA